MTAAVNQLIERIAFQRLYYAHNRHAACASTRLVSHDMMLIADSLRHASNPQYRNWRYLVFQFSIRDQTLPSELINDCANKSLSFIG